jgi:hypothetical protein
MACRSAACATFGQSYSKIPSTDDKLPFDLEIHRSEIPDQLREPSMCSARVDRILSVWNGMRMRIRMMKLAMETSEWSGSIGGDGSSLSSYFKHEEKGCLADLRGVT